MLKRCSYEELCGVLVGALEVEERADGLHAKKCTARQIEAWGAIDPFLGANAAATTGIRLDFWTNSKRMRFAFSSGKKVELLIDELLRAQYDMDEYRARGEAVEVELNDSTKHPKEEVRVTLTFPSHDAPGVLQFLELDADAYIRPCTYKKKLLFIGDSITQGWASEIDSDSFAYRVSRFFEAESVIQGVGGGIFRPSTLERVSFEPDAVVVAYGTNDAAGALATKESFERDVVETLDILEKYYGGHPIFVISPIWRGHSDGRPMEDAFRAYRDFLEQEVKGRRGLILVPGLELVPPMPRYFQDTYLHPNDLGFSVYSERLIGRMLPHLSLKA